MMSEHESTKRKIEVMQAFLDGKDIECRQLGFRYNGWHPATIPSWNWTECEYRVKTEVKAEVKAEVRGSELIQFNEVEGAAETMRAYMEGKKIQYRPRSNPRLEWADCDHKPKWNWKRMEYRVKPKEPKKCDFCGQLSGYATFHPGGMHFCCNSCLMAYNKIQNEYVRKGDLLDKIKELEKKRGICYRWVRIRQGLLEWLKGNEK